MTDLTDSKTKASQPWIFLFVAVSALWGASFLFMRVAGLEFGPLATACLRMGIGAVFMLPILWQRGLLLEVCSNWLLIFGISLVNAAIPFACYSFAVLHITTSLSAILNATVPMFAAIVSWLWLGQRLNRLRAAGLLVGFVGVSLLVGNQAALKGESVWMSMAAVFACLLATLCYGISGNVIKQKLGHLHPWSIAGGTMLGAAVWLLIPAMITRPQAMPSVAAWGALAVAGVMCSAIAFMLYFDLMQRVDIARTSSVTYLIPVFAILYGAWFLNETITWWTIICGSIVVLGTALATGLVHFDHVKKPTQTV